MPAHMLKWGKGKEPEGWQYFDNKLWEQYLQSTNCEDSAFDLLFTEDEQIEDNKFGEKESKE